LIALPVNTFQYLILRNTPYSISVLEVNRQASAICGSENYCDQTFFEPIVGDALGTISSRARANIVGD
jgi:hypothetical protein